MELVKPFIVFGLPRSMTAWTSCFLTCGPVFCQHEITGTNNVRSVASEILSQPFRYSGIADPSAIMCWPELLRAIPDATLVFIHRRAEESRLALATVADIDPAMMSYGYEQLQMAVNDLRQEPGLHVLEMQDLKEEFGMRLLWSWVAPDVPLPEAHLQKMKSLHVEQRRSLIRSAVAA